MYFREVYDCPFQCCQSVQSLFIEFQFDLTANHCDTKTAWPERCDILTAICATLSLPVLCSLLHAHVWMDDCILAEKPQLKLNPNHTSPVQVTQPSSTQDSFAKSNGPALLLSSLCSTRLFLCPSPAVPHQAPPHSSLPLQRKDGRWRFVCQRLCRWMGNSRWVIWVGRMPQHL